MAPKHPKHHEAIMNYSIPTLAFPKDFADLFDERYFRRLLLHYIVWTSINPPDGDELSVFMGVEQLLERVSGHSESEGINLADALYHLVGQGLLRVGSADPRHLYEQAEGMSVEFYEPARHANCRFTSPDPRPFEVMAQPGVALDCPGCQAVNEELSAQRERPEPYHDDATDSAGSPNMA
jgi:hypothetical protein